MSILGDAASSDTTGQVAVVVLIIVAFAIATPAGVFNREKVVGPERTDSSDPVERLFLILLAGFAAMLGAYGLCAGVMASVARGSAATRDSGLPVTVGQNIAADLIARAVAVAAVLALTSHFRGEIRGEVRRLGLALRDLPAAIPTAIVGISLELPLVMAVSALTEMALKRLHWEGNYVHDLLKLLGNDPDRWVRVGIVFSAVVAAPVSEELLFRGCLQTALSAMYREWPRKFLFPHRPRPAAPWRTSAWMRWTAILSSSIIFAGFHPWWSGPQIFVLAVCLGYAYERTGNLWTPMIMHAAFNAVEVAIYLATLHAGLSPTH